MPQTGPLPRRTVLSGAVAALCAGPVLTACGSSSGSGQQATTMTVKTSDVPVGGGVIDPATGVVVVQPTAGAFKAFSSVCPHQGCTVDSITNGTIICPCHGSTFRVSDGSVITGPATQGLTALAAKVQGSEVVVSR